MYNITAFLCGLIFGCGLTISNMINPNKVQNFLDITGNWDPSLAFVMLSAVVVTWIGYKILKNKSHPVCADKFFLPTKKVIDAPLIAGSAIFGIGWGLAGYCPGPAITALGLGILDAVYFLIGMICSLIMFSLFSLFFRKTNIQ